MRKEKGLTTAPETNMYISVGVSFCRITSSLGGKYSASIWGTFQMAEYVRKVSSLKCKEINKNFIRFLTIVLLIFMFPFLDTLRTGKRRENIERRKWQIYVPIGRGSHRKRLGKKRDFGQWEKISSVICWIWWLLVRHSKLVDALTLQFWTWDKHGTTSDLVCVPVTDSSLRTLKLLGLCPSAKE